MDPKYARETKGPEILGVFWALYIVSLLMVAARLYTRALWLRNIGLDDYIIAVCMVLVSAFTALTTAMVILGYGRHSQVVVAAHGPKRLSNLTLMSQINYTLGIMSFATPKFAIAALLNRVMNPGRFQRVWLWFLTTLVFVTSCICIIIDFTLCDPPEALWHPELLATGATCRPLMLVAKYAIFTGAISAFADMYLAIYPVVVLSRLQMTLKKKLALCGVLGLGSVACVMAIIKCFQLPSLTNTTDSTFASTNLIIWTSVEANVITMASCIPTLGPWWEMLRGKRFCCCSYDRSYTYKRNSSKPPSTGKQDLNRARDRDADLFTTQLGTRGGQSGENTSRGAECKEYYPPSRVNSEDGSGCCRV